MKGLLLAFILLFNLQILAQNQYLNVRIGSGLDLPEACNPTQRQRSLFYLFKSPTGLYYCREDNKWDKLVSATELNIYNKNQVNGMFGGYYRKSEINTMLTSFMTNVDYDNKSQIFVKKGDLDIRFTNYYQAIQMDGILTEYVKRPELSAYLKTADLNPYFISYYNRQEVDGLFGSYYKKNETDSLLAKYPTITTVNNQFSQYYKSSQVDGLLTGYVSNTALTSQLAGYTTNQALNSQLSSYLTSQAFNAQLANYYTKSEVDTLLASAIAQYSPKISNTLPVITTNNAVIGSGSTALNYNKIRVFRVSSDIDRTVAGFNLGQIDAETHYIVNVGTKNITFVNNYTLSILGVKLLNITGANVVLKPNMAVIAIYDAQSQVWRIGEFNRGLL